MTSLFLFMTAIISPSPPDLTLFSNFFLLLIESHSSPQLREVFGLLNFLSQEVNISPQLLFQIMFQWTNLKYTPFDSKNSSSLSSFSSSCTPVNTNPSPSYSDMVWLAPGSFYLVIMHRHAGLLSLHQQMALELVLCYFDVAASFLCSLMYKRTSVVCLCTTIYLGFIPNVSLHL